MSRPILVRMAALVGGALLACAHGRGAGAPEGDGSGAVALHFAWPDGYRSHVLVAHQSRRRGSEPTGLIARQRLVTEKKGDEIWVLTRDTAARGNEPDLETTVKLNEALVQVVGSDGRFLRAEGLDRALSLLKSGGGTDRESTRQALIRSVAMDWEVLVGAWTGQKLSPDEARQKQLRGSVPLLGTAETLLDVEYMLEGRVPCTDEEKDRKCVALSYRTRIAPEDRAATVERIRRAVSSKPEDPVPEDVHADAETLLVVEPDTLLPHRFTQRESLRVRMKFPDGRVQEADERSEDVYLFSDRPPNGPEEKDGGTVPWEGTPRDL